MCYYKITDCLNIFMNFFVQKQYLRHVRNVANKNIGIVIDSGFSKKERNLFTIIKN